MKKCYLFILFALFVGLVQAQYYPQFKQTIHYNLDTSGSFSNYQIRLEINTAALVTAGEMQADGDDIRFGLSSCDTSLMYRYFIESGMNSSATVIWVKIPSITGQTADSMYMFYGDSAATIGSDFNTTFPNAFFSNGNITVSGAGYFDWFEVKSGDTIFVGAEDSTVKLFARNVIINGAVWGKGSGYAFSANNPSIGRGYGPGITGNASGSGGGAYGGNGGKGCYDNGDTPGAGGALYGTDEGDDINMGSSGANSINTKGGAGGGMIEVNATWVYNNGDVNFDGNPGQLPGGSNGGGGGAGGGIKVICKHITNGSSGRITAIGGQGSDGTSAPNDGGGGGGGGRLKFFCETYNRTGDSILAYGGRSGIYGDVRGDFGDSGTVRFIPDTFYESYSLGQVYTLAGSISAFSCGSYSSPSGKYSWNANGKYVDVISGTGACDSVIVVNLTIVQGGNDSIAVTTCNSYTLPSGKVVTSTNVYYDTIPISGGCDSVHIVNLTVKYSSSASINASACNSYMLPSGSNVTTSGIYTDTIANAVGCDSIITINLTINMSTTGSGSVNACNSYKLANGTIVTTSGNYVDSLQTSTGCDSIVTINVTINNSTSSSVSPVACGSFTLPKGKVVTTSGTYMDTIMNANGCDSVITFNVTINTVDTAVNVTGNTITAALAGANYQWINCTNSSPISGATNQSYTATASGSYAVIITSNSCVDTSRCVSLIMAGIDMASNEKNLILYPNPTSGVLNIQLEETANISVINILGVELVTRQLGAGSNTIDLSGQPEGIYFLRVKSGNSYIVREIVLTR